MVTKRIRQKLTGVTRFKPLMRFRLWLVPLVVLLLLATGWWMRNALEQSVKQRTADKLEAILNANLTALDLWLRDQRAYVAVLAGSDHVRKPVIDLEGIWRQNPGELDSVENSPALAGIRDYLVPVFERQGLDGFAVVAPDGTMIAGDDDDWIGVRIAKDRVGILAEVLAGETVVSHPFFVESTVSEKDEAKSPRTAIMVVAAPVLDEHDRVTAMLALLIDPDEDFTRILQSARLAHSGETYAFNAQGLLISHSRFDDQLRAIGLIPADPTSDALLTLEIRDPGGDLESGYSPEVERAAQPLTRMAASAVSGQSGVDVDGYRDYRGVMVVGAWTWVDEYEFGVASEIDRKDALAMPAQLKRIFWTVIGLFVIVGGLFLIGSMLVSRMGRQMSDALSRAQQLGQYTLEDKLGEGGMGQVYRASHAMLRRPTAIKLMHPERAGKEALARFEREVQATSLLTHPNTIAIYDYGRTPDGVFYYAMEYLAGIDLGKLVEEHGAQPQGRVIHTLLQVCGSLEEAHSRGLIHRDIKPENVILCQRGGRHDVAKVLDFGIVKYASAESSTKLTAANTFTGTPLYVPPEAWSTPDKVDARADIYALGAVGYFMLTGLPLFEGGTVVEIYNQHIKSAPVPPSQRSDSIVAEDLERVILRCLEKDRGERPQSARELAEELAACRSAAEWTEERSRAWWAAQAPDAGPGGEDDRPLAGPKQTATIVSDIG